MSKQKRRNNQFQKGKKHFLFISDLNFGLSWNFKLYEYDIFKNFQKKGRKEKREEISWMKLRKKRTNENFLDAEGRKKGFYPKIHFLQGAKSHYRWYQRYREANWLEGKKCLFSTHSFTFLRGKCAIHSCCGTGKQNIFCSPNFPVLTKKGAVFGNSPSGN